MCGVQFLSSKEMSSSKIHYSLVSRGKTVLSDSHHDQQLLQEGCMSLSQSALELMEKKGGRGLEQHYVFSGLSDTLVAYVLCSGGLLYVCVTDKGFLKDVAFQCLEEMEMKLKECGLVDKAMIAGFYSLRSEFSKSLYKIILDQNKLHSQVLEAKQSLNQIQKKQQSEINEAEEKINSMPVINPSKSRPGLLSCFSCCCCC